MSSAFLLPARLNCRFLIAIAVAVWLLISCSKVQVATDSYANSQKKYEVHYFDGVRQGPEYWWYESGQLKYKAHFEAGKRHGRYAAWYPNGHLWYEGHEDMGVPDSVLTLYYPNGKVRTRLVYGDGVVLERTDFDSTGIQTYPYADKSRRDEPPPSGDPMQELKSELLRSWITRVQKTVEGRWSPPEGRGSANLSATTEFEVTRHGSLLNPRLLEASLDTRFNQEALKMLKALKRVPPLPAGYPDDTVTVKYKFLYHAPQTTGRKLRLLHPETLEENR